MMSTARNVALDAWIDSHFDEEVRFLQELVRVPSDTPPGNNTPHAERTAELLEAFGFEALNHTLRYDNSILRSMINILFI